MLQPFIWMYESDEQKQTPDWANKVITRHRYIWRPIVTTEYYRAMKGKLLSAQDLTETVKRHFADEDFLKKTKFQPLPIMEKIRNIIIDQAREAGIRPYIKSVDPSAKRHKEQDLFRLKTKQLQEQTVNTNRSKIGMGVPFQMDEKEFNGNVPEFDKMGLNPQDKSDVAFFFDTYYKLNYEAYAQTAVIATIAANKSEDDIPRYCNDILGVKCVCKQDYVSASTGQIVTKYLQPNQTYAIFGNNRDATDAPVRGWERQITVREVLQILGTSFRFETDWFELIRALNYGSNTKFDGFIRGGIAYNALDVMNRANGIDTENVSDTQPPNLLNFDDIFTDTYNYKVYFGYIEWEQPCVHTEKESTKTGQMFTVPNSFTPTEKSPYVKKEWGYFKTKTSNYIATGSISQKLYNYGDQYMMRTKGQDDEYSCGSISIIREEGLSAMGIAELYIDIGNYAFYKMLWALHRSKPDVWSYAYESIVEVAKKMTQNPTQGTNVTQSPGAFGDAVSKLIDMFDKKLMMLHTYPIVDGQVVGGGGLPHQKIPGQLDAIVDQLRTMILDWAEMQIGDKLGLSGLAAANAPNPRDGLKLNQLYLRQSKSAIGYIQRMIDTSFKHTANVILQYIQDILNFKDTIAYKYLLNLVGDEAIQALESIGNEDSPHRFAIYATSYSLIPDKEAQMQEAMMVFQNGNMSYSEYQLIKGIDEPRLAAKISAYFQEKAEKRKEAQAMQTQQAMAAQQQKMADNEYRLKEMMEDKDIEKERIRSNAYIYTADKNYQAKTEAANANAGAAEDMQAQKLTDKKQEMQDKATIDLQKSLLQQ